MGKAEYEIVVAFLDSNRGFAFNNRLPWPHLKGDYKFYVGLISDRKNESKKNSIILGRICWEFWEDGESAKENPNIVNVVTSSTLKSEGEPYLDNVSPSLDDALSYLTSPPVRDQIETIYLLGGQKNYDDSIDDPRLKRIWVTRIFDDFKVDRFFPKFEHKFKRVKCDTIDESLQEDNGIKYQFELWERFSD